MEEIESPDFFCNKCLFPMSNCSPPFSLTQCGHIFCNKCIIKVGQDCPSCDSTGIQSITLVAPLSPSIANLFVSPSQLYEQLGSLIKLQTEQYAIRSESIRKSFKKHELLKKVYWEVRKRVEREKQELQILQQKYANLKAEELYISEQQVSANNALASNFLNVDNSYRYQMNPNSGQNYTLDLLQQHVPHYQNHRHPKETRYPYTGFNTTPDSGHSTASTLQGSIPSVSGTPQNFFRLPDMKNIPRFKKSTLN